MKYLRFGEIPASGKSINFLKMTYEQQAEYTYFAENGDYDHAFEIVPEDAFEAGLSVFEKGKNGMPVLPNLQSVTTLLARLDCVIWEVSGDEIARGNDGEPLITNVKIEKKRRIRKAELVDLALSTLLANFKNVEYSEERNCNDNTLLSFCVEQKVNMRTGEKINIYADVDGKDWVKMPSRMEYTFNGWTFSDPVENFDVKQGIKR